MPATANELVGGHFGFCLCPFTSKDESLYQSKTNNKLVNSKQSLKGKDTTWLRTQSPKSNVLCDSSSEAKNINNAVNTAQMPSSINVDLAPDNKISESSHEKNQNALSEATLAWVALNSNVLANMQNNLGCKLASCGRQRDASVAWQQAANAGNPRAHFNLAILHHHGYGVQRDAKKAVFHYKKASLCGHSPSMYNLSILLRNSGENKTGVSGEDIYWLEKAAEKDLPLAQRELAIEHMQKSPRNIWRAIDLLWRASSQGDPKAEYFLGLCFEHGLGIEIDRSKALDLLMKAKHGGLTQTASRLEKLGYSIGHMQLIVTDSEIQTSKTMKGDALNISTRQDICVPNQTKGYQALSWDYERRDSKNLKRKNLDPPPGLLRLPSHFNHGIMEDNDERMFPHYGICDKQKMIGDLMDLPINIDETRLKGTKNIFNVFGSFPMRCNFAIFEDEFVDF